ncbi:MAG: response regulator, partial [Blautia sp.]|nr:response regulator [Blautia sp.]
TAAIRGMQDRPDARSIPIIAMTANAFAEDVQASLDAGMNGHIAKPIVMDEVEKAIARNVNR